MHTYKKLVWEPKEKSKSITPKNEKLKVQHNLKKNLKRFLLVEMMAQPPVSYRLTKFE